MNQKIKFSLIGLLLVAGFAIVLCAANEPVKDTTSAAGKAIATAKATVEDVNAKEATVKGITAQGKETTDGSLLNKSVEGTVVIKSSADSEEEDPYADEEKSEERSSTFTLTKDSKTGLLTIDSPGEDIRAIVRKVADLYNLNIMIPTGLSGATTLKLRDVTWMQLFNVMLPPAGYAYAEDKNIILIKSKEEISAEPTETRVFLINYATAGDLSASITPLIDASNGGKVQVDRRSNALVITERPSKFNNIKDIIERLDKPTPQVLIETKFIDIDDTDDKNLGVNWSSLSGYKLAMKSAEREWTRDPSATMRKIISDSAVFSAPEFDVVLSSLSSMNGAHLVCNPTVVALNNTEANINIGTEYPIPQYSYNQEQGVFEISGFEYKPIGVNLKVTPQLNSQGYITLSIAPEVSSSSTNATFGGTNGANYVEIPIITTRKSSNIINLKDGHTLAIGGLIQTTTTKGNSKVPLLGDIPVAGQLFKSDSNKTVRRNLIIFITARTVNPDGSGRSAADLRQLHDLGLTASDLPGYQLTPEEERLYKEVSEKQEILKREEILRDLRKQDKRATEKITRPLQSLSSRARR